MKKKTLLMILLLTTGCQSTYTPEELANWACRRIVDEAADPDAVTDGLLADQRASGISDEAMYRALWAECGLELGLQPPP